MTEDEAREKWCPYSRNSVSVGLTQSRHAHVYNRRDDGSAPESCQCIASECMAWRWSDEVREVGTDIKCEQCGGTGVIVTGSGENAGGEECQACVAGYQVEGLPTGFCGLAGQP